MIVLDTSVVSLVFKGDPRSGFYLPHMAGQRTVVSFQTVEGMWYGAYKAGWGARQKTSLRSIWSNTKWYGRTWKRRIFPPICESNERRLDVG